MSGGVRQAEQRRTGFDESNNSPRAKHREMMTLKIEFYDFDTNEKIILVNDAGKVKYHHSERHDPKEFEMMSGKVMKLSANQRKVVQAFYDLAGQLI
jgi:hypothetical protein